MGYFALINGGVVSAVIVADQAFIDSTSLENLQAEIVYDVSSAEQRPGPGYTYDPETHSFSPPG
jgi:hypothetical protein